MLARPDGIRGNPERPDPVTASRSPLDGCKGALDHRPDAGLGRFIEVHGAGVEPTKNRGVVGRNYCDLCCAFRLESCFPWEPGLMFGPWPGSFSISVFPVPYRFHIHFDSATEFLALHGSPNAMSRWHPLPDPPLPLLITGIAGVAGYNAFDYFQRRYISSGGIRAK